MTERRSEHNQNYIPVLDQHGEPMAPTKPSRVRRWLESGRGRKRWINHTFAVQLDDKDAADAAPSHFSLNLDPGETTGVAVTQESPDGANRAIVAAFDHQHRHREISHNLEQRSDQRRKRRSRIRRRPERQDNRKNSKGKLAPSLRNMVDDYAHIVATMRQLFPISLIRVEYLKFDTQLLQNPNIKGKEYQQGKLYEWNLRHYIFDRDHWTCQYCGRTPTPKRPLTMDHIIPDSKGGPTRVDNLIAACMQCNNRKDDKPVEQFLAKQPEKLAKIRQQLAQMVPLTPAGRLNAVMPSILETLQDTGLPVIHCDSASTAFTRKRLGILKSHSNDAACLDLPDSVEDFTIRVTALKRQGRHHRQSINCTKHGSPDAETFPAYSRLSRDQQGYTTPPAHSVGPRRRHGVKSGDLVRIRQRDSRIYFGRATMHLQDDRVALKRQGPGGATVTAESSQATIVAYRRRWSVSHRKSRLRDA